MRKLRIADGQGTVEVRGRRAVVKVRGCYVGTLAKHQHGCWTRPGSITAYPGPADAAEALADATAYGRAA